MLVRTGMRIEDNNALFVKILETVTAGAAGANWKSAIKDPPKDPDAMSVVHYLDDLAREAEKEPLLTRLKTNGRQVNEKVLDSWHRCGFYRALRPEQRKALYDGPLESVLHLIRTTFVGPVEVNAARLAIRRMVPLQKETLPHLMVRVIAGIQNLRLLGGDVSTSEMMEMVLDEPKRVQNPHGYWLQLNGLFVDRPPEPQEDSEVYVRRLAKRQCQMALPQESMETLEAKLLVSRPGVHPSGQPPVGDIEMSPMEGGYHGGRGRGDCGRFRGRADGGRGRGHDNGGRGRGDGRGPSGGSPGAGGGRHPQVPPANPNARVCWQWQAEGRCGRATCHFSHSEPPSQRPNWRAPSQDRLAGGGNSSQ
jgi:hypothetical protein